MLKFTNSISRSAQTPVKRFGIFSSLLLALGMVSCDQIQKQPVAQAVVKDVKPSSMNATISANPLAAALIRVGKEGIETGDDKALDAFYAKDFVFHGPGADMNLAELKASFTNYRNALTGYTITQDQIIVEGNFAAARNTFSGTFDNELKQSPVGPLKPTGKPVRWEVINTFRYDEQGRLAEEWIQNDGISFLQEFGVDILKTIPKK